MIIHFTKMHGLGNDFMVVDTITQHAHFRPEQIRKLADRHMGVGFDQLLLVEPPGKPDVDFRYRIFNADGSEVEQCGNGARCFAVYVRDYYPPDTTLETIPGRWRWEDGWPIERTDHQEWFAHRDHTLSTEVSDDDTHRLKYKASVGLEGGGPTMWWGSLTPDQQGMDDDSLVYDSEPLTEPLEILGRPN